VRVVDWVMRWGSRAVPSSPAPRRRIFVGLEEDMMARIWLGVFGVVGFVLFILEAEITCFGRR
jgi:hypothetical protein